MRRRKEEQELERAVEEKSKLVLDCAPIYTCLSCKKRLAICWAKTSGKTCFVCSKTASVSISSSRAFWKVNKSNLVGKVSLEQELDPVKLRPGKKIGRPKNAYTQVRRPASRSKKKQSTKV